LSENVVLVENTRALYEAVEQLVANGAFLTLLNVIAVAVGLLLALLVIADWSRRRWGNFLPILVIGAGFAALVLGFLLLGIVGTPVGMQNFAVAGDDLTQVLLREAKQVGAPLAALSIAALSSGVLLVTLGGAAIWKNRRRQREQVNLVMEVAAA
jgi:hypothetical protein